MTSKTLPVGSIIKVGKVTFIVAGVRFIEKEGRLVKGYACAVYPVGFTGQEHMRLVPAEKAEPVWEGYRSPLGEPFLKLMDGLDAAAKRVDAKT